MEDYKVCADCENEGCPFYHPDNEECPYDYMMP